VRFVDDSRLRKEEVAEELIARVRESNRMTMIVDVPLGAFLSGGVDSSGVVAMMARLKPAPVSTFSISFGTRGRDESAKAAEIARCYGTDHNVRSVDLNSFDLLDRLATVDGFGLAVLGPIYLRRELGFVRATQADCCAKYLFYGLGGTAAWIWLEQNVYKAVCNFNTDPEWVIATRADGNVLSVSWTATWDLDPQLARLLGFISNRHGPLGRGVIGREAPPGCIERFEQPR